MKYFLPKGIVLDENMLHRPETLRIQGVTVTLTTGYATKRERVEIKQWLRRAMATLFSYAKPKSLNAISVCVFLTPYLKKLGLKGEPLGEEHVNSAYEYDGKEIVVFRKEDWKKVLIHELCHIFRIDEVAVGSVMDLFPIPTNVDLLEIFSETVARILYCRMVGRSLQTEADFSCRQMVKVLNHYDLTFEDVCEKRNLHQFREKSNVFAYYVVPAILMNDVEHSWGCLKRMMRGDHVDFPAVIKAAAEKMRGSDRLRRQTGGSDRSLRMIGGKNLYKTQWKNSKYAGTGSSFTRRRSKRSKWRASSRRGSFTRREKTRG
jgi:hypothetical protein